MNSRTRFMPPPSAFFSISIAMCLASFWWWPREVTISLRLPLRFVLCCMNFVRQQKIAWKCHLFRGTMSLTETFDKGCVPFQACHGHQTLPAPIGAVSPGRCFFLFFFCCFDNSVSHSASTRWAGFPHASGQMEGSVNTPYWFEKRTCSTL